MIKRKGTTHIKALLGYSSIYFLVVFSIGFIFGAIRVLFVAPYLGDESAELLEAPFMVLICFLAARVIVQLTTIILPPVHFITLGVLALFYLLVVELSLVLWLRELSLATFVQSKYSLAGLAYLISLILYAMFPYVVFRWKNKLD